MTDRDQFAAASIIGIITGQIIHLGWKYTSDPVYSNNKGTNPSMIAKAAYEIADAMLKEKQQYETDQRDQTGHSAPRP